MSDAVAGPTPTQLQDAGLVAITEVNGYPLRSYNSATKKFPPETAYISAKWNAPPAPPPPPPPLELIYGVNNGYSLAWPSANFVNEKASFALAQQLGFKTIRATLPWNYTLGGFSLYETGGVNLNPAAAALVNELAALAKTYGLTLVLQADGCLAASEGSYPSDSQYTAGNPITPQGFALAMQWLATQCAGNGIVYEIPGNEMDAMQYGSGAQLLMTPALATEAATLAYPLMKKADPGCTVWFGSVSNINQGGGGWNFMVGCYTSPNPPKVGVNCDGISIHVYTWPGNCTWQDSKTGNLATQITTFATMRAGYGDTSKPNVTETGWMSLTTGSGDSDPEMTEALQAEYLTSWYTEVKALPIASILWYALQDGGSEVWGLLTAANVEKPSFAAVQSLIQEM